MIDEEVIVKVIHTMLQKYSQLVDESHNNNNSKDSIKEY